MPTARGFDRHPPWSSRSLLALAAGLCASSAAPAFQFDLDSPDWSLRWDNTVKYSAGVRVAERNPTLATATPLPTAPTAPRFVGSGDRNTDRGGLISNRVDLLTEADLAWRRFGARLSAAAWYDQVYNSTNDNPGPQNAADPVPYNRYSDAVRTLHGRKAEVLDAFVYGSGALADEVSGSFRLGRHSFQWGESSFFGANGIAGTMAPTDAVKALSVPNTQFKDLLMKVPQASGTLNFGRNLSLGAYYQFRWEAARLPVAGSYFSSAELANQSTGATIAATGFAVPPGAAFKPRDSGQGGLQLRFMPEGSDIEYGLYATRFHAKTPNGVYLNGALVPGPGGTPVLAVTGARPYYHQHIRAFGASLNKTMESLNVGVEVSTRRNAALPTAPVIVMAPRVVDNDDLAGYAVGNTAHLQSNLSYTLPRTPLFDEGMLLAEVAWNRLLAVTRNAAALNPEVDRDAAGLQVVLTPQYRQVLPGLDLSVPVGFSYVNGRSAALGPGFGVHKGGQANLGLSGTYLAVYNFGLTFSYFYGPAGKGLFDQALRDRSYVSFNASTTF